MSTTSPQERIPVALLGATGSVGQRFIELLADHPWFRLAAITASPRSAGKPYGKAARWMQASTLPDAVAKMEVLPTAPESASGCPLVFSALDSQAADLVELDFAAAGHMVVSNAKSYRMDPRVPLIVPEVNPNHLRLLESQPWAGGLATNPNCSTIGLMLALKPLEDAFGIEKVHVVTLQALSGAGVPGVPSLQAVDNVVPFIGGEEDKLESETGKILGRFDDGQIHHHSAVVSAHCNRVPVIDGHTLCVSVSLARPASPEDLFAAWNQYRGEPQRLDLPTAPAQPVHVLSQPDAPQPRLHRDLDGGMAATVGRLRPCPLLDYKFVTLSHNTLRGAAGGALLLAELALARGQIPGIEIPQEESLRMEGSDS
ncbi:MAG: aspartate-semialdehyde dehydrogenase [Deltaproteobacteria bacterium]|nr:aspartate-semialdehyde dehydrogenase [Deltaproteobacteria bacterium]